MAHTVDTSFCDGKRQDGSDCGFTCRSLSAMAELTQQNIARFQSFQEEMLKGFMGDSGGSSDDSSNDHKKAG